MTLTPEQFNLIATKADQNRLEEKVDVLSEKIDSLLTSMDGVAKKVNDHESELAANLGAHDRFEERITVLEKVAKPGLAA